MHLESKMDFWIKENLNVLLCGKHGTGKTTMVKEAFDRNNLRWLYFSAATMDPWVDFIGVPKEKTENGITYLDLVRPRCFQTDEVDALFFDEFNRSHKKVRNAVMELIQFKSINGKKFNNLKIIWAAINPDEEENEELKYDVEKLDPAQLDRFHIKIDIPYKPDYSYFKKKYGEETTEAALDWWKQLDKKIQNSISPRRLDYALDIYSRKGDLRDVLTEKCNVSKLIRDIGLGSLEKRIKAVFASKDVEKAKEFIRDGNNFSESIAFLEKNEKFRNFFTPLMSDEQVSATIAGKSEDDVFVKYFLSNAEKFEEVLTSVREAGGLKNRNVKKLLENALDNIKNNRAIKAHGYNAEAPIFFNKKAKLESFVNLVNELPNMTFNNTIERVGVFSQITDYMVSDLNSKDAQTILFAIDLIINRSHGGTLEKEPYKNKLVPVVNGCIKAILDGNKQSPNSEQKPLDQIKYPNVFNYCKDNPDFIFHKLGVISSPEKKPVGIPFKEIANELEEMEDNDEKRPIFNKVIKAIMKEKE